VLTRRAAPSLELARREMGIVAGRASSGAFGFRFSLD
jgi:hypothetical protein